MKTLLSFSILFFTCLSYGGENRITIASDNWCPFVCLGSNQPRSYGLIVDIFTEAMKLEGIQVDSVLMPFNRAIVETEKGRTDGVYAPPIDTRLKMSEEIFKSRACFYTSENSTWEYKGLPSVEGLQFQAIADYGYDDGPMDVFLANQMKKSNNKTVQFQTGEQAGMANLKMLIAGRVKVVLEHEHTMDYLHRIYEPDKKIRKAGCLEKALSLVVGFSRSNPKSDQYISKFSTGLKALHKSGQYETILKKYQIQPL